MPVLVLSIEVKAPIITKQIFIAHHEFSLHAHPPKAVTCPEPTTMYRM
jgi:hypothetical protein